MTLYEMYTLIELILNKDYGGNVVTPDRFKQLIKVVNIDKFKKKFGLPEEYQVGKPIPKEYADITLKNTDDLKDFKVFEPSTPSPVGLLPYPANYAHRDTITYNLVVTIDGVASTIPRKVEILREQQASDRRGNYTKQPTTTHPIGIMRSDGIQIYPTTITVVDFAYYRFPIDPVFEYVQHEGYITYNAAASTEFEWAADEHTSLVAMILSYFGVNLREADIVQYANMKTQQGI